MTTPKRVVDLSARRQSKDADLRTRLLQAYRAARESDSGRPGVRRTDLRFAEQKQN